MINLRVKAEVGNEFSNRRNQVHDGAEIETVDLEIENTCVTKNKRKKERKKHESKERVHELE